MTTPAVNSSEAGTAAAAPRLWLVRHASPAVAAGTCYGALDVPADPGATRSAAIRLAAALPAGITVHASPLLRCRQLADALHELRPDLDPQPDAALAEMNFGAWEGRRWDAIGQGAIDEWTASFARHRPGGGESVADLMRRVSRAFDEACTDGEAGRDVAWITHAGVIRAATLVCRGVRSVAFASDWPADAPDFGAWRQLMLSRGAAAPYRRGY